VSTIAAPSDSAICEFDAAEVEASYTDWLRAKVQSALDDPRPRIPHAEAMARIRRSIEEVAREQEQGSR